MNASSLAETAALREPADRIPIARMIRTTIALLALFGAAPAAHAQELVGVEVRLKADRHTVVAGQTLGLTLVVDVQKDANVPATLVSGLDLEITIDGKAKGDRRRAVEGSVALAAGTRIERRLQLELTDIEPPPAPEGAEAGGSEPQLAQLGIRWRDVPATAISCRIVPDASKLEIATLDLAKTRVLFLTSHGEIVIGFRPDKAPRTVANFVRLAKEGFFDGTKFHRVVKGFMVQGGCPNTKDGATGMPGTGGPGWTIDAEFNDIRHVRGVLSMARHGNNPNSAGSQFFICHGDASRLDGAYTAFAEVVRGIEVVDQIANARVKPNPLVPREISVPVEPLHLHAAIVLPVRR